MSSAYGIKAIKPTNAEHVLGFAAARDTADDALFEVWNGSAASARVLRIDRLGQIQGAKESSSVNNSGTVGRPTYSFEGAKTTGIYYVHSGTTVRTAIGGADKLTVSATEVNVLGDLRITGGSLITDTTSAIELGDSEYLVFGDDTDYWMTYAHGSTQFEFASTTGGGGSTDAVIFSVDDGTDDVDFHGAIVVTGTITGTLATAAQTAITSVGTLGSLAVSGDASVGDDLTLGSDGAILNFGLHSDVNLTHVADTALLLNSSRQIQFGDSASYIAQSSDGVLRIDGEATIDMNASTAVLVSNDLTLDSDASVLNFGVNSDVNLTHVHDTGLLLNGTMQLQFNDASQYIRGASGTQLDIVADAEVEVTATLVDMNANLDVSGTITAGGTITGTLATVAQGNITSLGTLTALTVDNLGINGNTITANSGALNLTPASGSAIVLDGVINVDAGVVTGATSITSDAFVGPLAGNASTATLASTVTITDNESTNESNALIFTAGGDIDGGSLGLESDGTLTYNPSTGKVTATGFIGTLAGAVTGNASTATLASTVTITDNESTAETNAVIFTAGGALTGGSLGLESDGDFTYTPNTGTVTATAFAGALTGAVTGTADVATTVTVADSTDTTGFPVFTTDATGNRSIVTDASNLTYNATTGLLTVAKAGTALGGLTVGADGAGADVTFHSDTGSDNFFWDSSAESLTITGTNAATALDIADGNVVISDALTVQTLAATGTSTLATVDINAGAIDGTTIGGNATAAGSFAALAGTTITASTAFVPNASDGAALGTTSLEFSDLFLADGAQIAFGDDQEVTLTHVADTGLLLSDASGIGTTQLQFGDSGTYIHQSADGVLDLVADTEIEINATTIDVNGAVDMSSTLALASTLDMPDSAKILLGTGDDLEIYHDASNSYISDTGTGDLIITGTVLRPRTDQFTLNNAANSEGMINAVANGAVTLYFNGADKLATVTGGINVTGDTDTDTLTVSGAATVGSTLQVTGNFASYANTALGNGAGDITTVVGTLNWNDGGDSALSIANAGGDGTSIYAASGDTLYLGSNGAAAMYFDSGGNTTAMGNLTVGDNSADDVNVFFNGNGADWVVGVDETDDDFKICIGSSLGTNDIFVADNANGNVCIGGANFADTGLTVEAEDEAMTANFGSALADVSDWNGIGFGHRTQPKAGIFFKRTGNQSVGDLYVCNNNVQDAADASLADDADVVVRFGGNKVCSFFGAAMELQATAKLYLDGGGDTYIMEQSPDDIQWIVGGSELLRLVGNTVRVPGAYANTTASAVNMRVSSDGDLSRSTSSLRYKKDIEDYSLESSRAVIAGLRPITYRGKDDEAGERKHLGFIAEEVHEVEQQLVTYIDLDGEEAPDYVEYDRVVAPLVKVIQDLMDRIEALEA